MQSLLKAGLTTDFPPARYRGYIFTAFSGEVRRGDVMLSLSKQDRITGLTTDKRAN